MKAPPQASLVCFFGFFLQFIPPRVTVQDAMSDKCLQQARLWCSCQDSESRMSPMKPFCFAEIVFLFTAEEIIHSCWIWSGWKKCLQQLLLRGQGDLSSPHENSCLLIQQLIVSQGHVWVFLSLGTQMKSIWQEYTLSMWNYLQHEISQTCQISAKDSESFSQGLTVNN